MSKIALVTGANRGIGFATARLLAQSGATVIVGARDTVKGEQAAAELRGEDRDVDWVAIDVTAAERVRFAAAQIEERHGRLDILVNNAGIVPEGTVQTPGLFDVDMFRHTFETNLFGTMTVIDAFLGLVRAAPAGRIVNVSSSTGSLAWQADPEWGLLPGLVSRLPGLQDGAERRHRRARQAPEGHADQSQRRLPGFVQTDITPGNREHATIQPDEASRVIVEMALLADDGPSGTFVDNDGAVPW